MEDEVGEIGVRSGVERGRGRRRERRGRDLEARSERARARRRGIGGLVEEVVAGVAARMSSPLRKQTN